MLHIEAILFEIHNSMAPLKHKKLLQLADHWDKNVGVQLFSENSAIKLTHTCALYLWSVLVSYIETDVICLSVGCDGAKTRDDIHIVYFWIRFDIEGYPLTLHFGARRAVGSITGELLLKIFRNVVEYSDFNDVCYIGVTTNKEYKYGPETATGEKTVHFASVAQKFKKAGIKLGLDWNVLLSKLYHGTADGAGNMGARGGTRGWLERLFAERLRLDSIRITKTHCVSHQIDIFADDCLRNHPIIEMTIMSIKDLRRIWSFSALRKDTYEKTGNDIGIRVLELGEEFDDRWLVSTCRAVCNYVHNLPATSKFVELTADDLVENLEYESTRTAFQRSLETAKQSCQDIENLCRAFVAKDFIIGLTSCLQAPSESDHLDIVEYIQLIESTEIFLNRMRTSRSWLMNMRQMFGFRARRDNNSLRQVVWKINNSNFKYIEQDTFNNAIENVLTEQSQLVDQLKDGLTDHKEQSQFDLWHKVCKIINYKHWNLHGDQVNIIKQRLQSCNQFDMRRLFSELKCILIKMGTPNDVTVDMFVDTMNTARAHAIDIILAFKQEQRSKFNIAMTTAKAQDTIESVELWARVFQKMQHNKLYFSFHKYIVALNPTNAFAERQGRQGNVIRSPMRSSMLPALLNHSCLIKINTNYDFYTARNHVEMIGLLWLNVVGGFDPVGLFAKAKQVLKEKGVLFQDQLPDKKNKNYSRLVHKQRVHDSKVALQESFKFKLSQLNISLSSKPIKINAQSNNSDSNVNANNDQKQNEFDSNVDGSSDVDINIGGASKESDDCDLDDEKKIDEPPKKRARFDDINIDMNKDNDKNEPYVTPGDVNSDTLYLRVHFNNVDDIPKEIWNSYFDDWIVIKINGTGNCMFDCINIKLNMIGYDFPSEEYARQFFCSSIKERRMIDFFALDENEQEQLLSWSNINMEEMASDRVYNADTADSVLSVFGQSFNVNWIVYDAHTGKVPDYYLNAITFDQENPCAMLLWTRDIRMNGIVVQSGHYDLVIPKTMWDDSRKVFFNAGKHCKSRFYA